MARVGEIVQIVFAVPVGEHGLVVICPRLLAAHGLYGVYAHYGLQATVMPLGQRHRLA